MTDTNQASTDQMRTTIQICNFFAAMQAGRSAAALMEALFAPDAVYIEPFSGEPVRHSGRVAIMKAMSLGWEQPLPDMVIHIDHAEVVNLRIAIKWTCYSPGLPGGLGRGTNYFAMREDGLIRELETILDFG